MSFYEQEVSGSKPVQLADRAGGGDFTTLMELNVELELLAQYKQTINLLEAVLPDDSVPANQKAQVLNSCTAILERIMKLQSDLYSSERVKKVEQVFITVLRTLPDPESFLELYEEEMRKLR